ncbi:hypothetical protein D047_0033B, partial [Vibrio parahaemolyticus VPTS-2010_2]
LGLNLTICF